MAMSLRSINSCMVSRPAPTRRHRAVVVPRAAPSQKSLDSQVTDALKAAEEECGTKGVNSKDCEVAWDQAEELLAAKSHKKIREQEESDPLENYCKDSPDADECRIHEI